VRRDLLQHGPGQAMPQVPAVTNLDRAGQRPPDRLAVGTRPVPAHDLDARVSAQPCLQHLSGAARQDIDPLPGLGVDQHGRVDLPAAQREIIDTKHPRHADLGQREPQQHPQGGVPRYRDTQRRQQPRASTAR
jgi:hypothetical protein